MAERMNLSDPVRAKDELERAVESGDGEAIAHAAMINIWPLLTAHTALLVSTVSTLDPPILDRYPVLRIVHPMTAVLARTVRPFKPLIFPDDARTMSPEEVDFVILTQIIAFRTSGDIEAAVRYSQRLADRIAQVRHESRDRLDGPLWYFHHQIASTYLAAGDSSRALLELGTARQLGVLSAQEDAERTVLGRIALAHALRGSTTEAESALADARGLPDHSLAQVTAGVSTENTAAALIAVDRMSDDLDERLAALAPYDTLDLTWPFALLARTRAHLARQRPDDAREMIRLARDSHPLQQGSFAVDVIDSASIDALADSADLRAARRVAAGAARPGPLTRIASVRLSLREGNLDAAASGLRALTTDRTISPVERAECGIMVGWLELAQTGDLRRETAMQLHRVAQRADGRRLATTMPRQLVAQVDARLPPDRAAEFRVATAGLAHIEISARPALTASEVRVLSALADNGGTVEVAAALHVSPNTVKSQLRAAYRKLGVSTREDALRVAAQLHLLPPGSPR